MTETNNELQSGGFSDGTTIDDAAIQGMQEGRALAKRKKIVLIDDALRRNEISSQYADLLTAIKTSTTTPEEADLMKVRATLDLQETLRENGFSEKRVAYIGAGNDWQFVVALGARTIDMVDLDYGYDGKEQAKERMLESVKAFDPDARFDDQDERPTITFQVNLYGKPEQVTLAMHAVDASQYTPSENLGGVIEALGPSKGYLDGTSPVLPNVARSLANGALIFNSDFDQNNTIGDVEGCQTIRSGKFSIYKVKDSSRLISLANHSATTNAVGQ